MHVAADVGHLMAVCRDDYIARPHSALANSSVNAEEFGDSLALAVTTGKITNQPQAPRLS